MDVAAILEIISTVGFPIACVIALGAFIFHVYKQTEEKNAANMAAVQERCAAREEKLYSFLEDTAAINAKFAEIIARYETKLDEIKADVKEIKTDIVEIKAHQ